MSFTISAWVVGVLVFLTEHFGLPFTEAELSTTVTVIVGIASFIGIFWGRYRQGDIDILGRKI